MMMLPVYWIEILNSDPQIVLDETPYIVTNLGVAHVVDQWGGIHFTPQGEVS